MNRLLTTICLTVLLAACGPQPPVEFGGAAVHVDQQDNPTATVVDGTVWVVVLGVEIPLGFVVDVIDGGDRVCVTFGLSQARLTLSGIADNDEPICRERHRVPVPGVPPVETAPEPEVVPEAAPEPEPIVGPIVGPSADIPALSPEPEPASAPPTSEPQSDAGGTP